MGFSTNYADTQEFSLKPKGDYECIITAIEERTTRNNKTGLNLTLTIRNDLPEQKFGNGCLFYTIWKAVEPTDKDRSVNGYRYGQIMSLAKAAQLPENKSYADMNEFVADLVGRCVLANLTHEEYEGKTRERVNRLGPTKHPDCKHRWKSKSVTAETAAPPRDEAFTASDVVDESDDYPF